ncbi:MAG: hypothetical protein LBN10_03000 [Propionibacteriaceae bacterium]|jgi:hypothetical protein|nr:hypothetical protein [Propionibacteriaceae bacterium]
MLWNYVIAPFNTLISTFDAAIATRVPNPPAMFTSPPWAGLCQLLPIGAMITSLAMFIGTIITCIVLRIAQIALRTFTVTTVEV